MLKMSMAGPLLGGDGDTGASTINARNVDGGTLGGDTRYLGAPTMNARKVDDRPPGR
jgi:hypothetical protein